MKPHYFHDEIYMFVMMDIVYNEEIHLKYDAILDYSLFRILNELNKEIDKKKFVLIDQLMDCLRLNNVTKKIIENPCNLNDQRLI
jgi:hypothetical protein